MKNSKKIIGIIQSAHSLSKAEKNAFVEMIRIGEPFPEDLVKAFTTFLDEEEALLTQEEKGTRKELQEQQKKFVSEYRKSFPKKKKVLLEARAVLQKIVSKFEQGLKALTVKHDKEIEKIVHDEGEQSEIDSIRSALKKPKEGTA